MEYAARKHGYSTGWKDISDLAIPKEYLKQVMAIMNRMRDGRDIYTDEAYANLRQIMISIAQIVMKPMSGEDMARSDELAELPESV